MVLFAVCDQKRFLYKKSGKVVLTRALPTNKIHCVIPQPGIPPGCSPWCVSFVLGCHACICFSSPALRTFKRRPPKTQHSISETTSTNHRTVHGIETVQVSTTFLCLIINFISNTEQTHPNQNKNQTKKSVAPFWRREKKGTFIEDKTHGRPKQTSIFPRGGHESLIYMSVCLLPTVISTETAMICFAYSFDDLRGKAIGESLFENPKGWWLSCMPCLLCVAHTLQA